MARLCGRPGCSEVGVVAYGMVAEDLLFWIAPLADSPVDEPGVLCARHADAMVVPRGWTLDDRRENALRLFKPRSVDRPDPTQRRASRRPRSTDDRPEQLQIDGTGEISRPADVPDDIDQLGPDQFDDGSARPPDAVSSDRPTSWEPAFDHDDDLNGLLEVSSPLLSRAFRGTERRRS